MRLAVPILLLILASGGFAISRLTASKQRADLSAANAHWENEVAARDNEINRLRQELDIKDARNRELSLKVSMQDRTLSARANSREANSAPSSTVSRIVTQRMIVEPKKDGLSVKTPEGEALFDVNPNGSIVEFGSNTFHGPNGEIFRNRANVAGSLTSRHSNEKTKLTFKNRSSRELATYWIDWNGKPRFYRLLKPGEEHVQETYVTHPWVILDRDGNKVQEVLPQKSDDNQEVLLYN